MKDVIETGFIIKKTDGQSYPYTMMFLCTEHLRQVIDLRNTVVKRLKDKDFFIPCPEEVAEDALGDKGVVAGVFVEGELIAVRVLYFVGNSDYNLGTLVGVKNNELNHVVHMEFSVVLPEFRGNGLQKRLSSKTLERATAQKAFLHVCSMVSPKNYPSILDKFSFNLYIKNLALVHGDHWRYIFHKNLKRPFKVKEHTITKIVTTDYDAQIAYLSKGYVGFALEEDNGSMAMLFGQPAL